MLKVPVERPPTLLVVTFVVVSPIKVPNLKALLYVS